MFSRLDGSVCLWTPKAAPPMAIFFAAIEKASGVISSMKIQVAYWGVQRKGIIQFSTQLKNAVTGAVLASLRSMTAQPYISFWSPCMHLCTRPSIPTCTHAQAVYPEFTSYLYLPQQHVLFNPVAFIFLEVGAAYEADEAGPLREQLVPQPARPCM